MSTRKYIKAFFEKVNEQETPGAVPGAPQKAHKFKFIFIDHDGDGLKKYPDGSSSKSYHSYQATKFEAEDWAKKNITSVDDRTLADSALEVKRQTIVDLVTGEKSHPSPEDAGFVEELKNACAIGKFGKKGPIMTVWFSPKGQMLTDDIETTFIQIKKLDD